MIDISAETIAAAKNNDLTAITAVIEATEERVRQIAVRAATTGGVTNTHLLEELNQVGRVAVWEALARFEGENVAQLFKYMDTTVRGAISDSRREEIRQGVSRAAAQRFEAAMAKADGDEYEAERLVQDPEVMGGQYRTLSPELAEAARLAWRGVAHLDVPVASYNRGGTVKHMTLGELLADTLAVNPEDALSLDDYDSQEIALARKELGRRVRHVLSMMGREHQIILGASFGIGEFEEWGTDKDADDRISEEFQIANVKSKRSRAKSRFRELWTREFGEFNPQSPYAGILLPAVAVVEEAAEESAEAVHSQAVELELDELGTEQREAWDEYVAESMTTMTSRQLAWLEVNDTRYQAYVANATPVWVEVNREKVWYFAALRWVKTRGLL